MAATRCSNPEIRLADLPEDFNLPKLVNLADPAAEGRKPSIVKSGATSSQVPAASASRGRDSSVPADF